MSNSDPTKQPQYIGVECHVCGTRMYGLPAHVGRKLKCPDCGARTVLVAPPHKPKSAAAIALEGEQYELWEADEQPLPAALIAAQPNYVAVTCKRCDTIIYATEKQIGETVACPDCGHNNLVLAPPKPKPKRSVLASDRETPVLDPAAAPIARPAFQPITTRGMDFEEASDAAYAEAKEKSRRTGKSMEIDVRGRPVMPRWPLLTGILRFPFYAGCRERWAVLTLGLILSVALILDGVPAWLNWAGDALGALEAIGGLAQTAIGIVGFILWLAAMSSIVIAIVSQSAVGNDRIAEWPPLNFIHSMSEMLPVSVAAIFTSAPGWMLGKFLDLPLDQIGLLMGAGLLVGFPIALLSQLAGTSTWNLIDWRVLSAMVRCPISVLTVYIQSAILAGICVAAAIAVSSVHEMAPLALAPLYVGCLLLYARILGRLAWRLSEKMPDDEPYDLRAAP